MGGDWRAIVLGVAGLVASGVSVRALTVTGQPVLSTISATGSVHATDGELVDLLTKDDPDLPLTDYVYLDEQAGINVGGVIVTGYENARAFADIFDTKVFGFGDFVHEEYDVSLSATAGNDNPYGLQLGAAGASVSLTFQFEVYTLYPYHSTVPVDLVGKTSGNGASTFEVTVTDSNGNIVDDTGLLQAGNSLDENLFLTVGQVYTVTTTGEVFVAGNGTANLTIDPFLEIDPNFASAQDFGLDFSPGLFPPVPEPSTCAMMLLGFAGLGFVGYRSTCKGRSDRVVGQFE
jgi:hypothetical protein